MDKTPRGVVYHLTPCPIRRANKIERILDASCPGEINGSGFANEEVVGGVRAADHSIKRVGPFATQGNMALAKMIRQPLQIHYSQEPHFYAVNLE